ncbi:beta strand repeat-containing protein, partial [Rudaea sp.]|uniref:beta strand repeat-containing protein n=1 Tax=Rudaea sp. TaxID=2136325 RepID=UPI002ED2F0BB
MSGTNTLRYDGGLFFGQAGNDPQQTTGQCSVARFPTSSTGTGFLAPTLAGNTAGSYAAGGVEKWLIQGVKVQCSATAGGALLIPYLITWNQGQVVVTGDTDNRLSPGTKSKCQAASASLQTSTGTPVTVRGWVNVTKQTNPAGATDTFAFTASNPSNLGNVSPASFNLTAGATQQVQIDLAGSSTRQLVITESALGGWSATPSITCTAADGVSSAASYVTVTGRTITANLDNTNFGANCTITNIATPASITTTKTLTSVNGNAPGANVKAGDVLVYTITSTNSGGTAGNVTLTETVPANTSYTGPDGGAWSCAANAPAGTSCTATQSVAKNGGSASTTFTVTVKTPVTDGATIANTVAVTGSTCSSCTVTKTASAPNLTLAKTANNAPWAVGQASPQPSYTLTVKNVGSAATSGTISVSDVLPNGITATTGTYSGWSCTVSGQTVACTSAASLVATSGLASIVLPVSVAAAAAPGVTNNASVGGGGDPFNGGTTPTPGASCTSLDANTPGHCASTTTTVNASADVAIVKTQASPNPAVPGQGVAWTITVTNNGPNAATAVTTSDVVPAAVSGLSLGGTDAGSCSISSQTVSCNFGTLANAATKTYTIGGTLASSFSGSLDNTATVTTTSSDPTPGNNTSTSNTPTAPKADLVVTKTASPSNSYVPGQALNYTVTVKNNGPSDANGVSVADTVPGTVTVSGWTCTASVGADCDTTAGGTGASGSTNAIALNNVNLPSGATITLAISGTAQLSATGDIVNTATATPPGGVSCSTPPCAKSSTVTNSNGGAPQLTIDKQATPSTFAVGANGTYSLTVTNSGSSSTSGTITVTDTMPSGITITATPTGTGWTCSTSTATQVTCTTAAVLLPGSNAPVINVPVTIDASAAPSVTNTAQASGGGDATCSTATPPARCSKTITTAVNSPQLDVKKQLNGSFVVGQSTTYTITVTNNGQSATIAGGTIADTIPAGLTIGTPLPADCSNPSGQQIQCTVPASLATGASHTYTIPVTPTVAAVGNNMANTATASGGGDATCPNAGHCSGQTTDTVTAPQLKLTKSASPATFVVGQPATYTLTLQNTGTAATIAVTTITDTIPAGLAIVTPLPANCSNPSGQTVTCTVASGFAVNATQSFAIQVTPQVGVNGQSVTNTASATGGGDPGCADGTASAALPARCKDGTTNPVNAPQLKMTKTASGVFAVGVAASYTLKVQNTGTAPTSGDITITDVVPGSLTLGAMPVGCGNVGQQVTCTITASLAVNASQSFVIPVTPTASASPSVSNTATAQGGGDPTCPTTDNCKSTIVTTVDAPSLQLSKNSNGAWTVGQGGAAYTLTVTNASATTATTSTITVQDAMPNGITPNWTDPLASNASWSCTHAGQNVSCTSLAGFSLAANGSDTITLPVSVGAAAIASGNSAQVTNNASVGGGGDPNNGGNPPTPGSCAVGDAHCASTTTTVNTAATINVVKTRDATTSTPIVAGQTVTYLFTATNSGASTVANYTISDVVPAHTTFAAVGSGSTTATSTCSGGAAAGTLCSITFASVSANGTATVKASFVVDASIPDGTLFIANLMSQPHSCTAAGCTPPPLPPGCTEAGCTPPTSCAADDPHCVQTPVAIADMQAIAPASVNATV